MKQIIAVFALVFAILLGGTILAQDTPPQAAVGGGGGTTTGYINPERVAMAMAAAGEWTEVYFNANWTVQNHNTGIWMNKSAYGTMNVAGQYTSFTTGDGKPILKIGDKPWNGFPSEMDGDRQWFNINVNCNTPNGSVYGGFSTSQLPNGGPIVINLRPGWVQKLILFPSDFDPATLRLIDDRFGWGYVYDPIAKGFWIWLDPEALGPNNYKIYQLFPNGDMIIWKIGSVQYGDKDDPTALVSSTTWEADQGVGIAYLNSTGTWERNQLPFNCDVETKTKLGDGSIATQIVRGKVLFTNAHKQFMQVLVIGPSVRVWVKDPAQGVDDADAIAFGQTLPGNDYVVVEIPAGRDGLFIKLIPDGDPNILADVYISGSPLIPPTGGGGMGVTTPAE